ncbi:hypothetical protein F2Q68_00026760 [Brassica cretica]|uniref:Uncharacterized protein n=1 Tax=Brassica cretica TaxID=69181 RepID=A0A8S9I6K3_BRACR|nr:hypothetical protein F2Q68_00026760 [Brassica cretica]
MANKISSLEDFVKVHGILLAASGLPQKLYARLFHKLASDTLDGGAHFQIEPCDDGRRRRLVLTSESMPKDSDVFLIDHAWTFRLPDAYKQVKQVIRQVFEAAALVHPEMKSDKSRAMYGVDVMLDSSFQPKILEVTYCPDCMRACTYDMETINGKGIVKAKEFFNYVFGCLFLGETSHVTPL